jgi:hypothetical protein
MTKTKRKQPEPRPVIIPAHPGFAYLTYDGVADEVYEYHIVAWAVWPDRKKSRGPWSAWGCPQPVCLISPDDGEASGLRYPDGSVLSLADTGRVFRDTGEYLAKQRVSYLHDVEHEWPKELDEAA